jgi:phenylpyruvate tautomerase PptA (4-oxalocrotonate tautomerase family)
MPYLQLDTPFSNSVEAKQRLAKRLGEIYSRHMNANINRLTVAIHKLGEGGVRRCGEGDPRPAALLMCDIRRVVRQSSVRSWRGSWSTRARKLSVSRTTISTLSSRNTPATRGTIRCTAV